MTRLYVDEDKKDHEIVEFLQIKQKSSEHFHCSWQIREALSESSRGRVWIQWCYNKDVDELLRSTQEESQEKARRRAYKDLNADPKKLVAVMYISLRSIQEN
jgi:hypothetical protein